MIRYAVLVVVTVLFCACSARKGVEVVRVESIKVLNIGTTGIGIEAKVRIKNGMGSKITMEKADFDIKNNGAKMAVVTAEREIVLPPRSEQSYLIPLRMRISRGAIAQVGDILIHPSKITMDGTIIGRLGVFRKRVRFNYTLTQENKDNILQYIKEEIGL